MFKLRYGYLAMGITTGFLLLFIFLWTLPDGKLHITFCSVGQGDSAYIKFPDGRDMIVDGGPDGSVLNCLGKYMPMWDRRIDLVLLTHPQKDHLQGLISIVDRYSVGYLVKSDVDNSTEGYSRLMELITKKHIPVKYMVSGDAISVGATRLAFLWPSTEQIAKGKDFVRRVLANGAQTGQVSLSTNAPSVLSATTYAAQKEDVNHFSLVFALRYGNFDALFPGDADSNVEPAYVGKSLADDRIEVLKVPHHGSKTGMTDDFIRWARPRLAIISVGKNSYGHPTQTALDQLAEVGSQILRTDKQGDIEIVSDGRSWRYSGVKNVAL